MYDEDERVRSCQMEIRRLRSVYRELYEEYEKLRAITCKAIMMGKLQKKYSPEELQNHLGITEEEYLNIISNSKTN